MKQKEIFEGARTVAECLEALRNEHDKLLDDLKSQDNDATMSRKKTRLLKRNIEMIELGLGEAHLIMAISKQLEIIDASTKDMRNQIRELDRENTWLGHELAGIKEKLAAIERDVFQFEEENRCQYYVNNTSHSNLEISIDEVNSEQDRAKNVPVPDRFNNEELDVRNISPDIPSIQYSRQTSNDYELPFHSPTLHKLVIHYATQKNYEIAAPLCKLSIENLENTTGHEHPDVATMLNILALIRRDQGLYDDAEKLLNETIAIREKILGQEHPAFAATLNNLAVLYTKIDKYADAEILCRRSLKICEKVQGSDHPDVAKLLNNLALICQNQKGKDDEIEKYYERALKIYELKLSPNDTNLAKMKKNLASFYVKRGKYDDAEILYKQLLEQDAEFKEFRRNDNRPIWQIAEEREEKEGKINVKGKRENTLNDKYDNGWHDAAKINARTVSVVLKNLAMLYRRQEKHVAAETLEDCALISALK